MVPRLGQRPGRSSLLLGSVSWTLAVAAIAVACAPKPATAPPPPDESPEPYVCGTLEAEAMRPSSAEECEGDCLGPLHLDLDAKEVEKFFGAPKKKSPPVVEEATGLAVSEWNYPERGLDLTFATSEDSGPATLYRIVARAPSALRTNHDIGIGSTRQEVQRSYGARLATDSPENPDSFVVDSVYGGLIFTFEGDRVSEIFFGAAAE